MSEPLLRALTRLRGLMLEDGVLVRAVASGRRRGAEPRWRRAEVRYVDLKAGRRLQVETFDATQSFTANHAPDVAREALDDLLDVGFGHWRVETTTEVHELRVTRKGEALVHTTARREGPAPQPSRSHDRAKQRLLAEDHPVLRALGISDEQGRVRPSRQAKFRQVEEFLRLLDQAVVAATDAGRLRRPTAADPLRVVDLGCGNAYLTFAAHAHLSARGLPVHLTGVDTKAQALRHGQQVAAELGIAEATDFVQGGIGDAEVDPAPDVVLALHACDTATDDALARAVGWGASLVLAAPCCHHDVAAQLRRAPTPAPYSMLTRDGILRERLADTLTDAMRASVLRLAGYRVDVVEFVGSEHTPRNTLLRAVRTGAGPRTADAEELARLTETWRVTPRLTELLPVPGGQG